MLSQSLIEIQQQYRHVVKNWKTLNLDLQYVCYGLVGRGSRDPTLHHMAQVSPNNAFWPTRLRNHEGGS